MKPDKIYINTEYDLYRTQKNPPFEETYIRKDYLLEWAKEMYETFRKKYRESNERAGGHWWQMVTFETLIDKLNEI